MEKTNKLKKNQTVKSGFSLVEVLMTLFILSIGLVAVSFLMINNIKSSETAKNQIIASQLAQEGIELVRNLKDSKNLDTLTSGSYPSYRIDYTMANLDNYADKRLYLNGNFYTHTLNLPAATKFYRRIDLLVTGNKLPAPSAREIKVTSYVTWNNSGFTVAAGLADASDNVINCNIANKCVPAVSVMPDLN